MKLRTFVRRSPMAVLTLTLWTTACSDPSAESPVGPVVVTEAPQSGQPVTTDALAGTETILLVEDEKEAQRVLISALTRKGYTVLAVSDGAEALEVADARTEPVHLLLADVSLPGLSAREIAEQLQEDDPELAVLFMAASDEATAVPTSVLLEKPFTNEELLTRVRDVLGE